jgi:hypothetical protein
LVVVKTGGLMVATDHWASGLQFFHLGENCVEVAYGGGIQDTNFEP